jgi:4-oxalomesaconate tautomerase
VPGTAAPVVIEFPHRGRPAQLLPTGRVRDVIAGIEVTCVDNGMPVVLIAGRRLGVTGYETPGRAGGRTPLSPSGSGDPPGGRAS